MRCALVFLVLLITTATATATPLPPEEAYLLVVDENQLHYETSWRHLHEFFAEERREALRAASETRPFTKPEFTTFTINNRTIEYIEAITIPDSATNAYGLRVNSTDWEPRDLGQAWNTGFENGTYWELLPSGARIGLDDVYPYGTLMALHLEYPWNGTFEAYEYSDGYVALRVAGVDGAVRRSDGGRIVADVPAPHPEPLPTRVEGSWRFVAFSNTSFVRFGSYPDPGTTLEQAPSRWSLIERDEYLRSMLWALVFFSIMMSAPLTALLSPKAWIGATVIVPSGIILLIATALALNSGILMDLYGASIVLALLGSLFIGWVLAGIATAALIRARNRRQ